MVSFTFDRPVLLWFLLCIPLLIITQIFTMKLKQRVAIKFAHFDLLSKRIERFASSYTGSASRRDYLLLLFRSFALCSAIFAAAGATFHYVGFASDFDYVLLVDNSDSMSATDIFPDRLSATKEAAQNFVDEVDQPANIGVISFSGVQYVHTRPVAEPAFVKRVIDSIGISNVGGTDISGAVIAGTNLLLSSERERTLVLLTDGQSNLGLRIEDAVDYALREDTTIYTIGVGTETGGYLADLPVATFQLDVDSLQYIANMTGGKFYRAVDAAQLASAYREIAHSSQRRISKPLAVPLLTLLLALLFFEWGYYGLKHRVVP